MATTAKNGSPHRWRFYVAGGVNQVRIDTGADIVHLGELDQKLWVALSCPVRGLEFDERTLALLDTDKDGRVRAPEIIAASAWLGRTLKDADTLVGGKDGVDLGNIDAGTPEGRQLLGSAKHILAGLGKAAATTVTVDDTMKTAMVFAQSKLNGDGVVPPDTIDDAAAGKVAADILDCLGGTIDRSGKQGVDAARVDTFFAECTAYAEWAGKAAADAKTILPFGEGTAAAVAAYEAIAHKVEDFFLRGRLAAYDPRAQAAVNRSETSYLEAAAKDLSITAAEVVSLPIALSEPGKALPLGVGVNPAWEAKVEAFRVAAVVPAHGKDKKSLTLAEWDALGARLAPFRAWAAAKAGARVERLGIARVKEILAGGSKAAIGKAIADDLSVAPEIDAHTQVERLARYHRDFHRLLLNFVSFSDFYARKKAIFQVGTLYLDGRATDLCVLVNDAGKHGLLAAMSKTYLAYVDCTRPSGEKMTIAAGLTAGDSDNLFVGRNGLFYDRKGRDWDAQVAKIVDSPISIGQAFWSPYKKLLRWIEESVAKRAAAADEASNAKLQAAAAATADLGKVDAPPPAPKKLDIGVVAALGVAVGGITAALGALLQALFGLKWLMPIGVLGMVLLISGPSMLIAWLKLRRRNLGPILDANGWAVNALTRVNIPLGRSLTSTAVLPPGSERSLIDPFAPKKSPWPKVLLWLLVLVGIGWGLWKTGFLSRWVSFVPAPEHVWGPWNCTCPPGPAAPVGTGATPPAAPATEPGMDAGMGG